MNVLDQWAFAVQPAKSSITLSSAYVISNGLRDDCMMAIAFGYIDELCKRLFILAMPSEREHLMGLFNQESLHCELNGNNFTIKN